MNASFLSRVVFASSFLLISNALPVVAQEASGGVTPQPQVQLQPEGGQEGFVEPKPGHHQPLAGWYLGVYGRYSNIGLLLTEVYPGTAAARAGIEEGDYSVAVNGHQIGVVLNRTLKLDVALQRYASRSGWVRLLIHDGRTQRLLNVDVKLTWGRVHT